jgi:hypothetical protein
MDLEGLPRRMARLGLMTPEQFLVEMGERMGSDLAEQKPLAVPGAQRVCAGRLPARCSSCEGHQLSGSA